MVPGKYPVTPNSRLLVNQAGVFSDQTENLAPQLMKAGLVNSAVWSDYDGDGWIDLWLPVSGDPSGYGKMRMGNYRRPRKISVFQIPLDGGHPFCPLISIPMAIWTTQWEILGTIQSILPAPGNH